MFAFAEVCKLGCTVIVTYVLYAGSGTVRWKFVHGLFENAIYGGRIDNTFDAKVLHSYLLQYFEQAVFPGQVSRSQTKCFEDNFSGLYSLIWLDEGSTILTTITNL